MTRQGRTAALFVLAAVVVAGGAFAVGQATGSESGTSEAQPLDPASDSQARPELASTPPVPALRATRKKESGGGSGSTQAEAPQSQATAPQAEAPQAQTQAPQAPAPQQPAAPQPETPVPGE